MNTLGLDGRRSVMNSSEGDERRVGKNVRRLGVARNTSAVACELAEFVGIKACVSAERVGIKAVEVAGGGACMSVGACGGLRNTPGCFGGGD